MQQKYFPWENIKRPYLQLEHATNSHKLQDHEAVDH